MANVYVLKNTRRQAVVKITGTGQANVYLANILYPGQYANNQSQGNVLWPISDLVYDVGNAASINRNGNVIFAMNAGQNYIGFTKDIGTSLLDDANANVNVNLGAASGTVIIQFSKESGFVDPDRQLLEPKDR
ncbi:MAG: hypothetical protein ACO294_08220 [Methylococcales bacterium]